MVDVSSGRKQAVADALSQQPLPGMGTVFGQLHQAISPWNWISPADVASNLPGGGIASAWDASGRARDALYAGNYGDAAREYGSMALNLVPDGAAIGKVVSASLPFLAKRADGLVNLGAVMRDVDRAGIVGQPRDVQRQINNAVDAGNWQEADVPIRSLYATQPTVNGDFAGAAAREAGDAADLPLVVKTGGRMYVRDGHHRITALANQDAQTARVRLVDVDGSGPDAGQPDLFGN